MSRTRTRWIALGAAVLAATIGIAVPALADDTTGIVSGHLLDGATPVAYASVNLIDTDYNYVASTGIDGAGAFQFADVLPGQYKLQFTLPDSFEQWASGQASFDTATTYTVSAGDTVTVEESVRPHGSMSGHVTNSDGSPAVGATVQGMGFDGNGGFVYATTDADGLYTMPYVAAGSYRVSFQQSGSSAVQYANNTPSWDAATPIAVTVGSLTILDQTFLATGAIAGTVTDSHGAGAGGIYVSAQGIDVSSYGSTTTNPDGTYALALFPGSYTISFQFPNGLTEYAPRQIDANKAVPILVQGDATTTLNEKLRAVGSVSGHLVDSGGNSVSAANVSLEKDNLYGTFATTDESGAYTVSAFPGSYRLVFGTPNGIQWHSGQSSADASNLVTITANGNQTVDETLAAPGSLVLTASDAATHQPLQSFCAYIANYSNYPCTEDGTIAVNDLLPGRYGYSISLQDSSDYLYSNLNHATIASGQTTTLDTALVKGASVTTTIRDTKTGAPVANACLTLTNVRAPQWFGAEQPACSDASGQVTLANLPAGTYKPFVMVHDGVHGSQWVGPSGGVGKFKKAVSVTLVAGQAATLPPVKLDKTGTISGTVTDAITGAPLTFATVGLSSYNRGYGSGAGTVSTDAAGHYTLTDLGPYNWTLYVAQWQYASVWSGGVTNRDKAEGVKVKAGATTTFDVGMIKGTTLTGKVFGPDGTTRSRNARITIINADTGDEMGAGDIYTTPARYLTYVGGPQKVKLQYYGLVNGVYYDGWAGGADFASATTYSIAPSGTRSISVVMTTQQF